MYKVAYSKNRKCDFSILFPNVFFLSAEKTRMQSLIKTASVIYNW